MPRPILSKLHISKISLGGDASISLKMCGNGNSQSKTHFDVLQRHAELVTGGNH